MRPLDGVSARSPHPFSREQKTSPFNGVEQSSLVRTGRGRWICHRSLLESFFASGDISVFKWASVLVLYINKFLGLFAMSSNDPKISTTDRVSKSKSFRRTPHFSLFFPIFFRVGYPSTAVLFYNSYSKVVSFLFTTFWNVIRFPYNLSKRQQYLVYISSLN